MGRMLRVDFVTLFPEMVLAACGHSMLGKAATAGKVLFNAVDPRDFAYDRHLKVDDAPYGGAPGMLIGVEPVHLALKSIQMDTREPGQAVVLTDPTGGKFEQCHARELASFDRVTFLCGHYEGFDDRVRQLFSTHVFSIGDFVLTGGELPALVMTDAIVRLLPGVLGSEASLAQDSHSDGLLGPPNFTRPPEYMGLAVPPVLLEGNHKKIREWQRRESLRLTLTNRPDLLRSAQLDMSDVDMLSS